MHGCPWFHKSVCQNDHSLSPWHSEITTIAVTTDDGSSRAYNTVGAAMRNFEGEDVVFDGHNFKFDWLYLAVHGWKISLDRWVGDSSIAAYVLPEKISDQWLADYDDKRKSKGSHHRKAGKHSLKTLAPYFLNVEPFWEVEDHSDQDYALKDTIYTRQLNVLFEQKLIDIDYFKFYQRLLEWTKMLVQAEFLGLRYDLDDADEMCKQLQIESSELRNKIRENWLGAEEKSLFLKVAKVKEKHFKLKRPTEEGLQKKLNKLTKEINFSSSTQMRWLLRDYLGLDITGDDGVDSTGAAVLRRLSETREDVKTFHSWRKTNKLLTSFFPAYEGFAVDGTIHPIYNVDVTRTGRTSSQRPNAQQVTSKLKPLFKARPGYKIVGFDAAGIEAKLIAYYTEDPVLCDILKDGTSIHDFNCVKWFKLDCDCKDVKTLYPKQRKATKNVGFALFYNAGFNRIKIALAQAGFLISDDEAKKIHKQFKIDFKIAHREAQKVVHRFQQGEIVTNLLGRPLIVEVPQDAYMKGFNKLIQSSASDYLLHSAHRAFKLMVDAKIDAHPILFVHDYVGFEVKESQAVDAAEIIKFSMTDYKLMTSHGQINLEVDGGISDVWE